MVKTFTSVHLSSVDIEIIGEIIRLCAGCRIYCICGSIYKKAAKYNFPDSSNQLFLTFHTSDELWFSAESVNFKNQYKHHLYLKKQIRPNEIKAQLKAGILTITAPFSEKVPKTKVDVE